MSINVQLVIEGNSLLYRVFTTNIPNELLVNIRKRNRSYESDITEEYLQKIQQAYFEFFRINQDKLSILVLDVSGFDFMQSDTDYQILKSALGEKYEIGIHRRTASELRS
jgi:deoxyadenosine/deoxycytidine kinase